MAFILPFLWLVAASCSTLSLSLVTGPVLMDACLEGKRRLQHEACELLDPEDGNAIPTVQRKFPLMVELMHDRTFGETDSNDGIVQGGVPLWPWFDDSDSDGSTSENISDNSSEEAPEAEETEETFVNNCKTQRPEVWRNVVQSTTVSRQFGKGPRSQTPVKSTEHASTVAPQADETEVVAGEAPEADETEAPEADKTDEVANVQAATEDVAEGLELVKTEETEKVAKESEIVRAATTEDVASQFPVEDTENASGTDTKQRNMNEKMKDSEEPVVSNSDADDQQGTDDEQADSVFNSLTDEQCGDFTKSFPKKKCKRKLEESNETFKQSSMKAKIAHSEEHSPHESDSGPTQGGVPKPQWPFFSTEPVRKDRREPLRNLQQTSSWKTDIRGLIGRISRGILKLQVFLQELN